MRPSRNIQEEIKNTISEITTVFATRPLKYVIVPYLTIKKEDPVLNPYGTGYANNSLILPLIGLRSAIVGLIGCEPETNQSEEVYWQSIYLKQWRRQLQITTTPLPSPCRPYRPLLFCTKSWQPYQLPKIVLH